jgi:hypothetical protein
MATRVQGAVLIIEVRLSINLNNMTIEQVVAKMQTSVLDLNELVWDHFLFNGAPLRALEPLSVCDRIYLDEDPEWFNMSEVRMHAASGRAAVGCLSSPLERARAPP